MSFEELEEQINIIRKELFNIAAIKGFSDNRVMEISQRLDLYLQRYNELKKTEYSTCTNSSNLHIVQPINYQ